MEIGLPAAVDEEGVSRIDGYVEEHLTHDELNFAGGDRRGRDLELEPRRGPACEPSTLLEALELRSRQRPEQLAYAFEGRDYSHRELWEGSGSLASLLADRGIAPGDRVVLALPNGPEFFAAFFGAQRAGAIPVPVFPRSGVDRILDLLSVCGASWVILPSPPPEETVSVLAGAGAGVITVGEAAGDSGDRLSPAIEPGATAMIQYTSGSTGDPKGVVITHANLLTNVRQMIAGMEITSEDVLVSWLPVHHDMGLVLMTLVPFFLGARLILLPSELTDVRRWLAAIATHRGTFTAAPDFAYRLCLRSVRDPSRFDLSSLRVALNAAEAVRAETLRGFEETFGLDRVMVAGYGLAEATVGVSMQPPGTAPKVSGRGFVSIGKPFPGIEIRIVRGQGDGAEAGPGEVGEIVVESPANTSGYYRNPEAIAALFDGSDREPRGIRTGDLGYRDAEGDVFVVGRSKNIILQAGRNLAPQEIEETVEALPFVRRVAAVGIDRGGVEGEQAWVFAELRSAKAPPAGDLQEMARRVVERFHERLGIRPGRVVLLEPRSIPLTANGKIRYPALREAWLGGSLREGERIFYPESSSPAP